MYLEEVLSRAGELDVLDSEAGWCLAANIPDL
jgi:hypothetical protein